MYIPKHFENSNKEELFHFMKKYNFGIIVSSKDNKPFATHLPFIVTKVDDKVSIKSHMSKANQQWTTFNDSSEALVVFSEPHSYITPRLYEKEVNVPTWNYIAVHAYGIPQILHDSDNKILILEESFEEFDPAYKDQWLGLPDEYKNRLLKGIVAFKIEVSRLEGKFKLSQNHSEAERENIINHLSSSMDTVKNEIANYMKKLR